MSPGDALVIGADLVKPVQDLLLAYDDPLGQVRYTGPPGDLVDGGVGHLLHDAVALPVDLGLNLLGGQAGAFLARYTTAPVVALGLLALVAHLGVRRPGQPPSWAARSTSAPWRPGSAGYSPSPPPSPPAPTPRSGPSTSSSSTSRSAASP